MPKEETEKENIKSSIQKNQNTIFKSFCIFLSKKVPKKYYDKLPFQLSKFKKTMLMASWGLEHQQWDVCELLRKVLILKFHKVNQSGSNNI